MVPGASFKILIGTVLGCAAFVIVYGFLGIPPHPFIQLVVLVGPLVAAISWFKTDARLRHVTMVFDMGLFVWIGWPALIPWYVVKTRGWHALPLALLIMLGIVTPVFLMGIIEAARLLKGR